MAEPDDYDDAMIDELMMNGGGEFGEPSAAELEMEFEMEQEREFEMQQEREREMAGGPDGGPPTSEPPAPQPPAEPEPGLGGVAMEEEEEELEPPANVKASFSLPDGEGQINLLERPASGPGKLVPPSGSLLARPLASLMHDLDRRAAFELQADANPPPPPPANPTDDPTKGGQLWVDKYAPRAFVELLSDERLNRQVLRWLKQWNPLVFGTAAPPAESKASWQGGGGSWGAAGAGAGAGGGAGGGAGPTASKRPEKPLLLIAGPPGLGKTTLAHVAAAHAGYRTIEINSSDDRTAKVLRQRIKDATEVQSVFGAMSSRPEMARPVCVILDEIDGAVGGSNPNPDPHPHPNPHPNPHPHPHPNPHLHPHPHPHPNQAPWEALTLNPTLTLTRCDGRLRRDLRDHRARAHGHRRRRQGRRGRRGRGGQGRGRGAATAGDLR